MLNLHSLKSIDCLCSYDKYEIFRLTFTNFKRYFITYCSDIIYKYDSEKWALKKFYSLLASFVNENMDILIQGEIQ